MATDFIEDWVESDKLRDQLRPLFTERPPWDEDSNYRMDTIEVYFEAEQTKPFDPKDLAVKKSSVKYIKCNLNSTLLEVIQHANHFVP